MPRSFCWSSSLHVPMLVATLCLSTAAWAGEVKERTALFLTLYQNGPALVEDVRKAVLDQGVNVLRFPNISNGLSFSSVQLIPAGEKAASVSVLTHFYRPAASEQDLLRAVEGSEIVLHRTTPSGDVRERARVVRVDPAPLFSVGGTLRELLPGETPIFEALPSETALHPMLGAVVRASKATAATLSLRYLSGGLSWSANHVVELAPDGASLSFAANAQIRNDSAVAWRTASLGLAAGEISDPERPSLQKGTSPMPMAIPALASAPPPEALGSFYFYRLPEPMTLERGEILQVSLLSAKDVEAKTIYRFSMPSADASVADDRAPVAGRTEIFFTTGQKGLDAPIPSGTVRVYAKDATGAARYLGSDVLPPTAAGRKAQLALGPAFDVTAQRSTIAFAQKFNDASVETHATRKIVISNAGAKPAEVWIEEQSKGERLLVEESIKHEESDSTTQLLWKMTIPAQGSRSLTYATRIVESKS